MSKARRTPFKSLAVKWHQIKLFEEILPQFLKVKISNCETRWLKALLVLNAYSSRKPVTIPFRMNCTSTSF
jgi:hypothetical protein